MEGTTLDDNALWVQISQILRDLLPPEASIAVANEYQYLDYRPGEYDIHIQPGSTIPPRSIAARVVTQKASIEGFIDASLFGVPYFGRGYPFHLENTRGAVTVIYPPNAVPMSESQANVFRPGGANFETVRQGLPAFPQLRQGSRLVSPPVRFDPSVEPSSYITGQQGESWRPIPVSEIAYFESKDKRNWMYTKDEAYTTIHTLQSLEAMLPMSFLRIHRSYIVNIDMIDHISRDLSVPLSITLSKPTGQKLPVSQSYVRLVRNRLGF